MVPEIHLHVLASGSKGNAAVIEGPEGCVLVDCGLSRRTLVRRAGALGVNLGRVRAVVVTHEHTDHVSGLEVFCKDFDGVVVATAGTAAACSSIEGLPISLVGHSDAFDLVGMHVETFPTSHDVADPFGLRFSTDHDALGFCTDTGVLLPEALEALRGVRILALEANHDERMLREGRYPAFLKRRVGGSHGHLSNEQAACALGDVAGPGMEAVVAMHISLENNRPSVAVSALAQAVGATVAEDEPEVARTPDGRLTIRCASQTKPLTVW